MQSTFKKLSLAVAIVSLSPSLGFAGSDGDCRHDHGRESFYTLSNVKNQNGLVNEVYVYELDHQGQIQVIGQFATGGSGTGGGLGNQGALALSDDQRYLFAINAGSNEVSVFDVEGREPILLDHAAEKGMTPVSVTVSGNLVYVVNSGDDSIFGYRFDRDAGKLRPLSNSYHKLDTAGTGAAQISFGKGGDALVITEKNTNKIVSFTVDEHGLPKDMYVTSSSGKTPFGFAFGKHDQFFVSEAQGGAAGATTVSSYKLDESGMAALLDGSVPADQTAACWVAVTPDGRMAFTADAHSNAISSFAISRMGGLTLLQSAAATENTPLDLAVSRDGGRLFSLNAGDQTISVLKIQENGGLVQLQNIQSVPASATGLVVR